ncbi:MAG: flavodoxin family protein [Phycisphaerales bacterium]|nr:MAG: flavodoxin family protein [Phycisphaerales bacterium]
MKIVAIMGSYRPGQTIDTLVDRAIEGARSSGSVEVDKVVLVERDIAYCKNCMACRRDGQAQPRARCVIADDMQEIYPLIEAADGYIFGTPVNMGHVTAVMKTFLERICWVFARPGSWPLPGCPQPRTPKQRKAVIIASSGLIAPLLRRFCDEATPLIKRTALDSLNARLVGRLYAGAVEKRGVEPYLSKAYALGKKLAS